MQCRIPKHIVLNQDPVKLDFAEIWTDEYADKEGLHQVRPLTYFYFLFVTCKKNPWFVWPLIGEDVVLISFILISNSLVSVLEHLGAFWLVATTSLCVASGTRIENEWRLVTRLCIGRPIHRRGRSLQNPDGQLRQSNWSCLLDNLVFPRPKCQQGSFPLGVCWGQLGRWNWPYPT